MPLTKTQIIGEIYNAFNAVLLENGIGLWEGLALDDRLENTTKYNRLKIKDERYDWQKIPIVQLYECSSAISFLDAKGIRFHLGLYLLFDLDIFMNEEDKLYEDKKFNFSPPEIQFALIYKLELEYSKNRFLLLNKKQIQCVIYFLEYTLAEKKQYPMKIKANQDSKFDAHCNEIETAIALWEKKLTQ